MDFRILGPLEVHDGVDLVGITAARQRAMLAALLLRVNQVVLPDELVDQLWGSAAPSAARTTIQTYVHRLRRTLQGPDGRSRNGVTLQTRSGGYLLEMDPNLLDLHRYERLVAEGRRLVADGRAQDGVECLEAALALWRGPALADIGEGPLRVEACRLDEHRLRVIEERNASRLRLGDHEDLVGELVALVAMHPLREDMVSQLMLALYRSGRQAEALAAYRSTRSVLVKELGVEPSAELQRLHRAILAADRSVQAPSHAPPHRAWSRSRADRGMPSQRLPVAVAPDVIGHVAGSASGYAMPHPSGEGEPIAIITFVITGPGVAMTASVVRVLHQLRAELPDGQLYVGVRYGGPAGVDPAGVSADLLGALGVEGPVP